MQRLVLLMAAALGVLVGCDKPETAQYKLTTAATGSGAVSVAPQAESYAAGATVSLTATPAEGNRFDRWEGDLTGAANPSNLVMDKDKSVTAVFVPITYKLTTEVIGHGTISRTPEATEYVTGSSVTLTPRGTGGYTFDHWEGDISGASSPAQIVMAGDRTVYAVFVNPNDGATIQMSIPNRRGIPGRGVHVPINVTSADGISSRGIQVEISYDTGAIAPEDIHPAATAITGDMSVAIGAPAAGKIVFSAVGGARDLKGKGHLFDIYANLRETVPLNTCVQFTFDKVVLVDDTGARLPVDFGDQGDLCLVDQCQQGDITGDGSIDVSDVIAALEVAVSSRGFDDCVVMAGDMNGDNMVDSADAVMILRKSAYMDINPKPVSGAKAGADPMLLSTILGEREEVGVYLPTGQTCQVGTSVRIPVQVEDVTGLSGYDLRLTWPAAELELVQVHPGTVALGSDNREVKIEDGAVSVSLGRQQGIAPDSKGAYQAGTLCEVEFRVPANAPVNRSTQITIAKCELKGQYGDSFGWYVTLAKTNGSIISRAAPQEGQAPEGDAEGQPAEGQSAEGQTPAVQADFTADKTEGPAPLTVQFTDASTGTITAYEWGFGDAGTTSAVKNPLPRNYAQPGFYTVMLSVSGPDGSDVETKTDYIKVYSKPVLTAFTLADNAAVTSSTSVTFAYTAQGEAAYLRPTHFLISESPSFEGATWQPVGSATSFTLSAGNGLKTVHFKVKNPAGESEAVLSDTIELRMPPVITAFSLNNGDDFTGSAEITLNNACTNSPVSFMASESSSFSGANWQSYSAAPSFTLSPPTGVKTVYFKVRNADNAESSVVSDSIEWALTPAVASFSVNSGASVVYARNVTLTNSCTNVPTDYRAGESASLSGVAWTGYSTAPSYTLSAGTGTKTVYFQVRNRAGVSAIASYTVDLVEAPVVSSFTINGGATTCVDTQVTLASVCANVPTHYMASESSSFSGASWQAYAASAGFTLSSGAGAKTVYFKVKNDAGTSSTANASITLVVAPAASSFTINNGASVTGSRTVTLNSACTGSPTHYMASESSSFSGASWLTYSASASFTLSQGFGVKTVYFKVKNAAGESLSVSDSIELADIPVVSSFSINNGAASTTSQSVTLNNACTGSPTHFMASESSSFSGASWQTYSAAPSFTLSAGAGTKTVYFKVKNAAGESSAASDSIEKSPAAGEQATFAGIAFRWCPAGTFTMGSPDTEVGRDTDETQHQVTLSKGFWMSETEVTQAQWVAVMGSNPSYFTGDTSRPVEGVSWNDICTASTGYLAKLNAANPGYGFRLPTEAEWEYAYRAGTTQRFYWGDDPSYTQIGSYAWYYSNSSNTTHPVGTKTANAWGLKDMSGNVYEWCADWYGSYAGGAVTDPTGPGTGDYRVLRGGSYGNGGYSCRAANRHFDGPASGSYGLGFRVVVPAAVN